MVLFFSVMSTGGMGGMGGMGGRLNTTGDTTVSMQEDSDEQQEVIEVQILPQVTWLNIFFVAVIWPKLLKYLEEIKAPYIIYRT